MENLIREYFFEGDSRGNPLPGYFLGDEAKGIPF